MYMRAVTVVVVPLLLAACGGTDRTVVVNPPPENGWLGNDLPQNFRPLGNGATEVQISRNCVVTYDASGYRGRSSNGCSGGDITRADQQFAAYRSQPGYAPNGQYGQYGQYGAAPNNMRFLPNGDTEIAMSNNCIITYNPGGYRISNNNRCSGDDITRSDQQFAAFRQYPNEPTFRR